MDLTSMVRYRILLHEFFALSHSKYRCPGSNAGVKMGTLSNSEADPQL